MTGKSRRLTTWLVITTGCFALVVAGFAAKDSLLEQYWLWKLDSDEPDDRRIATEQLGRLLSIRAIPKLIENFRRESAAIHSESRPMEASVGARALIRIGRSAVPALVEAFMHKDRKVRWSAGRVLGWIGPPAVPAVLTALTNRDDVIRASSARALAWMGEGELLNSDTETVVPALLEALGDRSRRVRTHSAWAVGLIDPPVNEAVPILTELLDDMDEFVRVSAWFALRNIKSGNTRVSHYHSGSGAPLRVSRKTAP